MFDFVHEKKRIVQIVLAIIILPFAFWGVDSYTRMSSTADVVAKVNGEKITQQELTNALRQQQDRLRQQLGAKFDAAMLDTPEMKRAVMENLIAQRLMLERARDSRLVVTDEQVARVIGGIEAFQDGGKFDKKRYESLLANQGMSPLAFEARLREEMLWQQMQDIFQQNGYASMQTAEKIIRLNEQQRMVSVFPVAFQPLLAQAKADEDALKKYYNQNMKEFEVREQARLEYVKFTIDDLLARVEVSKEDLLKYFGEHQSEFGTAEERRAAHILISVPANASQSQQDSSREKAEQLLQQARKSPAMFADLAKKNSQDPGSAANGGDLGFFGRGMMVKPFEEATFTMKPGEISDLVRSDFGYHIIKLIAVKPSKSLPFEQVREKIADNLRQLKAADRYAELAEKFSNTVYEQSDTLKPAADLAGSKIEQSGWVINGGGAGEMWTAKMLQAIFNDEVLKNKRNTAAIEVAPNTLLAARVLEYKPAAVRPFAEVRGAIQQKLLRQNALELAVVQGKALLAQLQSGSKPKVNWGKVQTITRAQHGSLDAGLVKSIYLANPSRLPQYVGVEVEGTGYMLARIDDVKDGDSAAEEKRTRYAQQLRQLTGEEMFRAYMAEARQNATIKVNLSGPATAQP